MKITEIDRLPQHVYDGDFYDHPDPEQDIREAKSMLRNARPLMGYKGFFWTTRSDSISIINSKHVYEIHDWDADTPGTIVGPLIVAHSNLEGKVNASPIKNLYQINTVSVRKQYQGRGLGTMLYLIMLRQLKMWLMAGDSQTPGGRKAWVSLSSVPGVEVYGLLSVSNYELSNPIRYNDKSMIRNFDSLVDSLMEIGFNHIGQNPEYTFFIFPVKKGKGELVNAVKKAKFKIYGASPERWELDVSLLARWTGK